MMKQLRLQAYGGDSAAQYAIARYCEDIGDVEQSTFWYRAAMQNGSLEALEKCEDLGVDCDPPRESLKDLKCRIYPVGYLENYMFTAVCTNLGGKWILSMHEERDTWETQGGHIEAGETPLECARRELFEESGILDADIYPICDYWGFDSNGCANGMVFLAVAHSIGKLPESEMKAVGAFDTLPENLTYPQVTPRFFKEAEELFRKL
jgi:8-oxo-dGTP diphosphatase